MQLSGYPLHEAFRLPKMIKMTGSQDEWLLLEFLHHHYLRISTAQGGIQSTHISVEVLGWATHLYIAADRGLQQLRIKVEVGRPPRAALHITQATQIWTHCAHSECLAMSVTPTAEPSLKAHEGSDLAVAPAPLHAATRCGSSPMVIIPAVRFRMKAGDMHVMVGQPSAHEASRCPAFEVSGANAGSRAAQGGPLLWQRAGTLAHLCREGFWAEPHDHAHEGRGDLCCVAQLWELQVPVQAEESAAIQVVEHMLLLRLRRPHLELQPVHEHCRRTQP